MGNSEEERELIEARSICSILSSNGWLGIENWIKGQITTLQGRTDPAGLDNIRVDSLNYSDVKPDGIKQIAITVVSVDKDYNQHAVRAFKTLLAKVQGWKDIAEGKQ